MSMTGTDSSDSSTSRTSSRPKVGLQTKAICQKRKLMADYTRRVLGQAAGRVHAGLLQSLSSRSPLALWNLWVSTSMSVGCVTFFCLWPLLHGHLRKCLNELSRAQGPTAHVRQRTASPFSQGKMRRDLPRQPWALLARAVTKS